MKIKTLLRHGVAALSVAAFFGVGLPVEANQLVWVRAQPLNYFKVRGLVPPGYFSKAESQKPATVALSKSGQGLGAQKPTAFKAAKPGTQRGR
jgi:hypothetical protein